MAAIPGAFASLRLLLGVLAGLPDGGEPGGAAALGVPISAPTVAPEVIGLGYTEPPVPAYGTPTFLFLNFDGAVLNSGCGDDPRNNCSTLSALFGGEILPFSGNAILQTAIVQAVQKDVEDFGIVVVTERPLDNQRYAMVMVGNSVLGGWYDYGFMGIAPIIDCGNSDPYMTSFALEVNNEEVMATIILQEAAHTWGLEHVDNTSDNLHPGVVNLSQSFVDTCSKIVSDTDYTPFIGYCNVVHTEFCSEGYQNSYQELLLLFGPPNPDLVPPTVSIDSPPQGAIVECPVSFDLVVTTSDDQSPQSMQVRIFLDDQEILSGVYPDGTETFPVTGDVGPGPHTIRVEVEDESGNPATDQVDIVVVADPNDPMCGGAPETTGSTASGGSATGTDGEGTTGAGATGGGGSAGDGLGTDGQDPQATWGSSTAAGDGSGGADGGCGCNAAAPLQPFLGILPFFSFACVRRRR